MRTSTLLLSLVTVASSAFAQMIPAREALKPTRDISPKIEKLTPAQRTHAIGMNVNGQALISDNLQALQAKMSATPTKARAEGETTEVPEVITETPAGTEALYSRSGDCTFTFWGYIMTGTQTGLSLHTVTSEDGNTMYIMDLVSQAAAYSWVKGDVQGDKVTIPMGQCVIYFDDYGYGMELAALKYTVDEDGTSGTFVTDAEKTEIVLTKNADGTISMPAEFTTTDATSFPEYALGLVYTDDKSWTGYCDWNSAYKPFNDEITTLPDGVTMEDWVWKYKDNTDATQHLMVEVGVKDDKVYIQGLENADPAACVVGTIADGTVTFTSDQYLGMTNEMFYYFTGASFTVGYEEYNGELEKYYIFTYIPELKMTYNAEAKEIVLTEADQAILLNGGKAADRIYYATAGLESRFYFFNEVAATPATPSAEEFYNDFEEYGYSAFYYTIPTTDTEGNFIDPEKMSMKFYTRTEDIEEPFIFYSDEYTGLVELGVDELEEIPYTTSLYDASGYVDVNNETLTLYQQAPDAIGVQSIYNGAGERRESEIAWYVINDTAIDSVDAESVVPVAIYSVDGIRLSRLGQGINIVKMSNGKVVKIMGR